MARGRMIDKRVSMSKKLGKVSDKAKVMWFIIYPHLDRKGRIAFDNLEDLKDEIIPKFKNWGLKKIADSLNEIADIGLIDLYPFVEKIAMEFKRFEDFQSIREDREAASKIVAFEEMRESSGVFRITPALSLSLSLRKSKEGSLKKEEEVVVVIYFDFDKREWKNIKDKDLIFWNTTYPACNIGAELNKMADWLISNPKKRKKNYRRFITNWLSRTQDKGGSTTTSEDEMDAWAKRQAEKEKKR